MDRVSVGVASACCFEHGRDVATNMNYVDRVHSICFRLLLMVVAEMLGDSVGRSLMVDVPG